MQFKTKGFPVYSQFDTDSLTGNTLSMHAKANLILPYFFIITYNQDHFSHETWNLSSFIWTWQNEYT